MKNFKDRILETAASLSRLVPKDGRLWIYGAWKGTAYSDNPKYLFEYMRDHPEIHSVWLTKSKKIVKTVRASGRECCLWNSPRGIWYALRAGAAIESEGEYDLSPLLNKKVTRCIQLWHGMGMKSMKWKTVDGKEKDRDFERYQGWDWMSCSQLYTDTIAQLLRVPKERFFLTGYPRNDSFVTRPVNAHLEELRAKNPGKKLLIYMPTHRHFGAEGNAHINIEELRRVNDLLKAKEMIMVYKPHFHELKNFLSFESEFSNIILAKEDVWSDVYSYLHYFDLLISDYSSVMTDFMCSGKPIVYFCYDLDDYIAKDAELNDYFWDTQGGPMCRTWDEVISQAEALLTNDTWAEERERCRKVYHQFNDGKNCERVYQAVLNILEEKKK